MKFTALRKHHRTIIFLIAIIIVCFALECFFANYPYIARFGEDNGEKSVLAFASLDGSHRVSVYKNDIVVYPKASIQSLSFDTVGDEDKSYEVGAVSVWARSDGALRELSRKAVVVEESAKNTTTLYFKTEKADEIILVFSSCESPFTVENIRMNEKYRFSFSFLRFFVLLIIFASTFFFWRLRTKKEYYYEIANEKKRIIAVALCLFSIILALLFGCLFAEKNPSVEYPLTERVNAYNNAYIQQFDAFKKGQLHIDFLPSEKFLSLENPYDINEREGTYYLWDRAFYNERYYSYFGVAPILAVYAPYEALTSSLPSDNAVMTVFGVIASLFFTLAILAFADRKRVKIPVPTLILGILSGLLSSGIFLIMRGRAPYYYIAVLSSIAFFYLFTYCAIMAFTSKRGTVLRYLFLVFSSLAFALTFLSRLHLAVGCALIIAPLIFTEIIFNKKERTPKRVIAELLCLASFAVLSILLSFVCNYLRFDSPFEFGARYQLTVSDISKNYIALSDILPSIRHYLFGMLKYTRDFPFITLGHIGTDSFYKFIYTEWCFGIFAIPLSLALPYGFFCLFDKKEKLFSKLLICSSFLYILFASLINFSLGGVMFRYTADILSFSSLLSVFLLFSFYGKLKEKEDGQKMTSRKAKTGIFVAKLLCLLLLIFSLIISVALSISENPNLTPIPPNAYKLLYNFFVFWK